MSVLLVLSLALLAARTQSQAIVPTTMAMLQGTWRGSCNQCAHSTNFEEF